MNKEVSFMRETLKQYTICNACRYCEGYCAVWDAIEFKFFLDENYIYHLANLCHDCRDCFYACPYNEPYHEFKLNIPKVASKARMYSYISFVRPRILKFAFEKPILFTSLLAAIAVLATVFYVIFMFGPARFSSLPITTILPRDLFEYGSIIVYLYVLIIWIWEGYAYWTLIKGNSIITISGMVKAIFDVLYHRNFQGGGVGCKNPRDNNRYFRLIAHSLIFYGFIISLLSIHFYPDISGYVGVIYFIGTLVISTGTFMVIYSQLKEPKKIYKLRDEKMSVLDYSFSLLLLTVGVTGVLVPLTIGTMIYNWIFLIHTAITVVVFILAPYSKFVHLVFRFLSILKYNCDSVRMEERGDQ